MRGREPNALLVAVVLIGCLSGVGALAGLDIMQAVADTMLAGLTAAYVVLTYGLLNEARNTRLTSMGSYVVADVEAAGSVLYFVIRNIGRGPAVDIRVTSDPRIVNQEGRDLTGYWTYAGLGPFQERRYFFYVGGDLFKEEVPLEYTVRVRYRDVVSGKDREHFYRLDLRSYRGTLAPPNPEEKIAKAVEKIARALGK